jgi:hypothetical protein
VGTGASIGSDGCCTAPGQLVVDGTLALTGGGSPATTIKWVTLSGGGQVSQTGTVTWDVPSTAFAPSARIVAGGTIDGDLPSSAATLAPQGALTVTGDWTPSAAGGLAAPAGAQLRVGGTATLAGAALDAPGVPVGQNRTVLAGKVPGTFGCLRSPGGVPTYAASSVSVLGVAGAPAGCLRSASGTALKGSFRGTQKGTLKPPKGATRVLLRVEVKGKGVTLKLKAGSAAKVRTGQAKKTATYVVLKLAKGAGAKKLTAKLNKRAKVVVTPTAYYL